MKSRRDTGLDLVKFYFRSYYRSSDCDVEVPAIEKREIAYQPFDKDVMIRHLGFSDLQSFRKFLAETVPAHVYYSTAYYADPDNPEMDKKGWEGADLVFDIDADHLDTDACKRASELGIVTLECLEDALEEARKLVEVLEDEFGIAEHEMRITFSGHRGFHVHVESEAVRNLGQDERRELIDYFLARSFQIDRFVDSRQRIPAAPDLDGIGKRLWRIIDELFDDQDLKTRLRVGKRILKRQLKKLQNENSRIASKLVIRIDEVVTLDLKRLIRVPNSLHGKTGLKVVSLTKSDLYRDAEHILRRAVPRNMTRGSLKIVFLKKLDVDNVLGFEIRPRLDEIVQVPPYVAIYLIRLGFAELAE